MFLKCSKKNFTLKKTRWFPALLNIFKWRDSRHLNKTKKKFLVKKLNRKFFEEAKLY